MTEVKQSAKELRAQEQNSIHSSVLWQGAKAGLVGLSIGLGASLAAQRYSSMYRNLKLPFKTFLLFCSFTAPFFTETDRAAMLEDRRFAQQFSITTVPMETRKKRFSNTLELLKDWSFENRHYIVGYGWLTVAVTTLLYQWRRKDIRSSQKVINARLTSQTLAFLGVAGIAALGASMPHEQQLDPHYEHVVNGPSKS